MLTLNDEGDLILVEANEAFIDMYLLDLEDLIVEIMTDLNCSDDSIIITNERIQKEDDQEDILNQKVNRTLVKQPV